MQSYDNYDDDFQDSNHYKSKPKNSIEFPKINNNSIHRSKSKDKIKNIPQFEQENYDQDFQQPKHKPIHKSIQKSNKSPQYQQKTNQKTNKIKQSSTPALNNSLSKQRSHSNKKLSLSNLKNSNIQTQSKYLSYLNTQFSHTREEILQLPPQKINRLNQKLRTYIKKVNDQLTELINQNMRKLKSNTLKLNTEKTPDDQIKILIQQKKNGQIYLQNVQKQYQSLNQKWEKIQNLQSGPNINQQISQITIKVKQISKQINTLKHNVTQQGNKLTEDNNFGQRINQLKNKLSKLKKDQEKNTQKLQKTESRFDELSTKNPEIDLKLQNLTKKAKSQNINVNTTISDKKLQQKHEELKKKIQNLRMHRDKTQSLNQTKLNIQKRDNETLKNQVIEIEKKSNQIDSQMNSIKQASVALIEEVKYQQLQPYIQTHLDFIYKNIMEGTSSSTINQKVQRKNSTKNVTQQNSKQGIKKYSSVVNIRKIQRSQSQIQLKPNFQIHKKSLFDQKPKQKDSLKLQNKQTSERIWKEQNVNRQEKQKQKPKQMNESSNSKPFVIRKSQNVNTISEGSPKISRLEASQTINEQKQNQKSSLFAPKMKFKKTENNEVQVENEKKQTIISEKNSNQLKKVQKDQQTSNSKPAFKIKRSVKQKAQIPEEELNLIGLVFNKRAQLNLNSQKQPQKLDKVNEENDTTNQTSNKKGPNFKLFKKSIHQTKQSPNQENDIQEEIPIPQTNRNQQNSKKSQENPNKQEVIEEDLGINVGRRQAGRKIQRKTQDAYIV